MHGSELTSSIQTGLGVYYLLVVLLNLGYAAYQFYVPRNRPQGLFWVAAAGVFLLHAIVYLVHRGWMLPAGFRNWVTEVMGLMGGQLGPILYVSGAVIAFILF